MKKITTLLLGCAFLASSLMAMPALKRPIVVRQADGTELTVISMGDEWISWFETPDGYTVLQDGDQYFYAVRDAQGNLSPSSVLAQDAERRTEEDRIFLSGIDRGLFFSDLQISRMKAPMLKNRKSEEKRAEVLRRRMENRAEGEVVEQRVPVILVSFADRAITTSRALYDSLINAKNYSSHGCTGSFTDYFDANSNGVFKFRADLFGPYTLSKEMAYYGAHSGTNNDVLPDEMIYEACLLADADGADFSKYDFDNDGEVDGVHIVFAGKGEESTREANAIWSHKSELYKDEAPIDGKKIVVYSCSAEISAWNDSAYLGAILHETSHALGLPDFYDTDGSASGGTAVDPGEFDIMATGAYNNEGKTPPMHNAWSRAQVGWLKTVNLEDTCTIELKEVEKATIAYHIQTPEPGEYFVLDYRGKESKWDAYIPGYGMLIFAVNENAGNWENNQVNINPKLRGFYIKQANGGSGSTVAMSESTPFPGATGATEFTDKTKPSSKTTTNKNTNKPIYAIEEMENGGVRFQFMGEGDSIYDNQGNAYSISGTANQELVSAQGGIKVYPNPVKDYFMVESESPVSEIRVYDMMGSVKQVFPGNARTLIQVDAAGFQAGLYVIEVLTQKGMERSKMVKSL